MLILFLPSKSIGKFPIVFELNMIEKIQFLIIYININTISQDFFIGETSLSAFLSLDIFYWSVFCHLKFLFISFHVFWNILFIMQRLVWTNTILEETFWARNQLKYFDSIIYELNPILQLFSLIVLRLFYQGNMWLYHLFSYLLS